MEHTLLVCKRVTRAEFNRTYYVGLDDILALTERGSFSFDCGEGEQRVGELEAVNFRAGVAYRRHVLAPVTLYLFRYRADGDVFGSGRVIFRDRERVRSTIALLQLCDRSVQADDFDCKRVLFADLINQYRLENAARRMDAVDADPVIAEAVAWMKSNLHAKIRLSELAGQSYLSYVQFARRFRQVTGTAPQDYLVGLRLRKAKALLGDTDLPIQQIAQDCGFKSPYYFSNFFRKYCRMSPTQYRTMIRSTAAAE